MTACRIVSLDRDRRFHLKADPIANLKRGGDLTLLARRHSLLL
jgi:hypothetical protein